MKKLFSKNGALTNKTMIVGVALAVIVALSYFGSGNYLNQSIMDMLMGGTATGCERSDDGCPMTDCPCGTVQCGSNWICPDRNHKDCPPCATRCGLTDSGACDSGCSCPHSK